MKTIIFLILFYKVFAQNPFHDKVPPPPRYDSKDPANFLGGMYQRGPPPDLLEGLPSPESLRDYPGQNLFSGKEFTGSFPKPRPVGGGVIGNYPERLSFGGSVARNKNYMNPRNIGYNNFNDMGRTQAENNQKRLQYYAYEDLYEMAAKTQNNKPTWESSYVRDAQPKWNINASPGMGMYWPEPEAPKKIEYQNSPRKLTEAMRNEAMNKIIEFSKMQENNLRNSSQQTDSAISTFDLTPKVDDFNSPIRWVAITSNETNDGLARVTDPKTGLNRQYVINGSVYVPIADYGTKKTSTVTSEPKAIETALSSLKNTSRGDWLAFEVGSGRLGGENECNSDGCQARCNTLACESMCEGDTCATGCVGRSCIAFCKGHGCMSMCIGQGCKAKCEGMSCEARCLGVDCDSNCRSLSCRLVSNGVVNVGGGTWEEHYPQYDEAYIKSHYPK